LFVQSELESLLSATIAGLGFELVKAETSGRTMRVFIDHAKSVNVDDCARVSEHLTRLFAVEGVEFDRLEVSSPGLDRELVKPADFVRFAGRKVRLKLKTPVDGRRNFAGILCELREGRVELDQDGGRITVALDNLAKARLVPELAPGVPRRKQ
jgi:ribosome maturation factor RimP